MKFNILHILLVLPISVVICEPGDDIQINNETKTDIPTPSTVSGNITTTTPVPTTTEITTQPSPTTHNTTSTSTTSSTTASTPITTSATTKPTTITTPTTSAPNITTTTQSSTSAPTDPPHKGRHFDGPSFIGGIILASGLMAICFVSWKFYKARTERNYHTL